MEENPLPTDSNSPEVQNNQPWYEVIPPFSILMTLRRKLKIGPKLVIGFGILIVLMLVGYGVGISSSNQARQEIDRTTNLRAPTTLVASQAQANLLELVADLQAYLALGDFEYKTSYLSKQRDFEKNLDELDAIINQSGAQDSSEYKELADSLDNLRSTYDQWSALVPQLYDLRDDQLRREPALKILIVDASPLINTVIVNSGSMIQTQEGREPTVENIKVMGAMANFQSSFYAMVAGLRGYVTTGRPSFKFEYSANFDANRQAWEILTQKLELLSPSQLDNLNKIETARDAFLQMPDLMFEAVEGEHAREDLYLFRTEAVPVANAMIQILAEETNLQQDLLQSDLDVGREQLNTAQTASITGAVVVLLAGLILAWAISRDMARPILRLAGTAQQIQEGDLAAQAEVTSEDEIGFLGRAFNAMTAKLRETLESLMDYLEQVKVVMAAADAVDNDSFEPATLDGLAQRDDALGQLARVFQKMAQEVRAREQRLRRQLAQLQLDIEEKQQAKSETVAVYIPMDRRQALASGEALPEYAQGAALFADISGFTSLTEALANELGLQRGAEEIIRQLNRVYTVLIDEVHRYGGSVINFSGDAITCWFDDLDLAGQQRSTDSAERAAACALGMQKGMKQFVAITRPDGKTINLTVKVAVAAGPARRILIGKGTPHQIDVLAGSTLAVLADTEHQANKGETLVASSNVSDMEEKFVVSEWRDERNYAVVTGLMRDVHPTPWPALSNDAISEAQGKPWLLSAVFEKVSTGKSDMLSELRQVAALFLKFSGIEYDTDPNASSKLNDFIQWVEQVIAPHKGSIIQLTVGDKGSYLYVVFGAPVAYPDDAPQAVAAAMGLSTLPESLSYITDIQIGLTYGQMRVGAYGGTTQRTYGAIGDKTNLAARLMQAAGATQDADGNSTITVLCNDSIHEAAQAHFEFEALPPIKVKGKTEPINIYRPIRRIQSDEITEAEPIARAEERSLLIDRLPPAEQLTLKFASVVGQVFSFEVLSAIYPEDDESDHLSKYLTALAEKDLIVKRLTEAKSYSFKDPLTHETAYNLMLFAQRRQLHRAIAEYLEQNEANTPRYDELAHHWQAADDIPKAIHYLEKAGELARELGDVEAAKRFFNTSLALSS
jgi:class 3 adenylate cyclase/CHASE3 domain sensor protein